jgi:hypothetical protein
VMALDGRYVGSDVLEDRCHGESWRVHGHGVTGEYVVQGGVNRRSAGAFRPVPRLLLEFLFVLLVVVVRLLVF